MALIDFYLSHIRFCEASARVSTDPAVIKALLDEAARYRMMAAKLGDGHDPYNRKASHGEEASYHQEGHSAPYKTRP
jgi:stalled ribosome alternative rescue factor ArfA